MKKLWLALFLVLCVALNGCGLLRNIIPRATGIETQPPATTVTHSSRTPSPSRTARITARPTQGPQLTADRINPDEQLQDVFRVVAGGSEYGGTDNTIKKWAVPLKLAIHGSPSAEDRAALGRAMEWLNGIEGFPGISVVQSGANVDIWFVELDKMKDVVDGYVKGNWGFFWTNYNSQSITKATIAIATDVTDQEERNHLIFEELVQSMGLMQDQYTYEDSIFYGNWTTVQEPSEMDWELVGMLYLPEVRHGMGVDEAIELITTTH